MINRRYGKVYRYEKYPVCPFLTIESESKSTCSKNKGFLRGRNFKYHKKNNLPSILVQRSMDCN